MQSAPSKLADEKKSIRQLTIAYYVDSHSMRRLSIPLRRANFVMATAIGVCLWSIFSFFYVSYDLSTKLFTKQSIPSQLPEKKTTLSAKLNVTTRVDKLSPTAPEPAREVLKVVDVPATKLPMHLKTEANSIQQPTVMTVGVTPKNESPPHLPPHEKFLASNEHVALSMPQLSNADGELIVKFSIINKAKIKTSGKVWGIASFIEAPGKNILTASSPGIDVDTPTGPTTIDAATNFAAARLTNKQLRFNAPVGAEGRFTQLKIYVKTDHGEQILVSEQDLAD